MTRNPDPVAGSVWARPPRSRAGQPTLGREQIVRAAIELLDADGADGLSMRRLGTKLGSGATSVYWYVANKDELLDLVIDEIMGEVEVPDPAEVGWRTAIGALVRGYRSMILRHTWFTGMFGVRAGIGPNSMRVAEQMTVVLTAAGFSGSELAYAGSLLSSYALGSTFNETAWRTATARSGKSVNEIVESFEEYRKDLGAEYPNYDAWWQENKPVDMARIQEESFAFGLERVLDGLTSWLERQPGGAAAQPDRQPEPSSEPKAGPSPEPDAGPSSEPKPGPVGAAPGG